MSMLILWLYTLAQALSNEMWLWKRRSHSQQLEGVESVKHSFGQIGDLVSIQNPEHRRDSQQKSKHTHPYIIQERSEEYTETSQDRPQHRHSAGTD